MAEHMVRSTAVVDIYNSLVLAIEIDRLGVVSIFTMVTLAKATRTLDVSTFSSLHLSHEIIWEVDITLIGKIFLFIFFRTSFVMLDSTLTTVFNAV
jgi:hypothetical protein